MKLPFILLTVLLLATSGASFAAKDAPIVGAIRWDGWYGDGGVVKAVEASLGQPKYHFRLPWFARVISDDKVSINGDSQAIMEQDGFDAISEYACAGKGYTTDPETYSQLTSLHVREKLWDKWKRERSPCITFATAGWDTRPRQERPPSWCSWVKATPDPTLPAQQNRP